MYVKPSWRQEVPQTAKSGNVEDLKTWEPMLQRCQEEATARKLSETRVMRINLAMFDLFSWERRKVLS